MTVAGWTLLIGSWAAILATLGFCFARILRKGGKEKI